mgnify:CR=1 FL=1
MDILSTIISNKNDFVTLHNFEPKNLYLGHLEMDELKNNSIIKGNGRGFFHDCDRFKFAGMSIFEVDTDVHMNMS